MPRPTTKQELLTAAEGEFAKLWKLIDSMPGELRRGMFAFEDRDRNVGDVLMHLWEWHQMLLVWVHSNSSGVAAPFLPEPYNWKTYPAMNVALWEKNRNVPQEAAEKLLRESHAQVMEMAGALSDEELFVKKYFPWTGTTSLGSYFISATSSHYDWAIKKLKRHLQTWGA